MLPRGLKAANNAAFAELLLGKSLAPLETPFLHLFGMQGQEQLLFGAVIPAGKQWKALGVGVRQSVVTRHQEGRGILKIQVVAQVFTLVPGFLQQVDLPVSAVGLDVGIGK